MTGRLRRSETPSRALTGGYPGGQKTSQCNCIKQEQKIDRTGPCSRRGPGMSKCMRVALLIESSRTSGRQFLRGIAAYAPHTARGHFSTRSEPWATRSPQV